MKTFNLIKWLWTDSHEKQSPQRFARFAAMLIMLLTLGVGQMWGGEGYNGETHVYLNVDGTTKYYKVSTESWSTGSSLPGTWGGVLKDQTFSNIHTLEIKGGAVGGWTENGGNISGNLYYKVTNNTTTPSSGWTTVGGINASYTTKSGNNCFRYKNDYSVNVTPHTAGTYYLHIKITDGASNNRTSYVKFTIPSYTVAGSSTVLGTNWDQTDTDNDMVWSSGTTYTLTKSNVVLTKDNTYEYKVAYNHAWTTAYPASNASIDFGNTTGHYDVTFTFNASTHAVSATATRLYAVSYNDNSSTSGSVPATTYHANGATVTVASNSGSLAKSNYTYGGWNTASDGSGTNYTAGTGTFTMGTTDKTLYAKWTQGTTVNANGGSANTTYTATWNKKSISIASAPTRTGYNLSGYYNNAACSTKIAGADGALQASVTISSTTWTNSSKQWKHTVAAATIYAGWTAKNYSISLDREGGSGSTTVTMTYNSSSHSAITLPSKTGYNFGGYWTEDNGTGYMVMNASGVLQANVDGYTGEGGIWTKDGTCTLYAKWTAKTTTITYSQSGTGYSSGGPSTTMTATYASAMPSISGSVPTAANGYAFMGYYDEEGGSGTQYYTSTGASARTWNKEGASCTLYAYFKKAEITELTLSSAIVAPNTSITVTPTISPTPTGTTQVCYEIQYSNGTALSPQPSMSVSSNVLTFTAPSASATYRIQATLETGSGACGSGTELSTYSTTFQVAGEHTVTVRYQDSDGRTIKASTEVTARPLAWTTDGDITPPTITGYTFARWDAGDGVSIKNGDSDPVTTTTTSSIQIKANYDGTLTAVYNKKNMIFFNNTLGWEDVWVYFYTSDNYWANNYGTGAWRGQYFNGYRPYYDMHRGHMTQIEGTNIWYFDYTAQGWDGWENVAFTNMGDQTGQGASANDQAPDDDHAYFSNTTDNPIQVVRRGDHKTTLPMFVPLTGQTKVKKNNNKAEYMSDGYWMNYPENTGYTLKIYNAWNANRETAAVQSIAFPYSEDKTMPLKMDVELSDGYNHDYWFMVYLNDGTYWGNEYHFKQGYNAEQIITKVDKKSKITTSAPGKYTFTLTYHDNGSGTVNYYIDVDYPIATGDYRIYYSDNATWSKAAHTKDSWYHPSHSIGKATTEAKKDTISFYIPKGEGILHTMKFQKASVTKEGIVSWSDVDGGSITIPSSVTTTGVYNFIVSQPAGGASISLEKVEPYTGNFYIRTDCAGNTKWDSFKNLDHQMTYSDYAANNSGFSHYFAHWVTGGNNVKFCIANDYSMCISDTLTQDYGTVVANIDANGFLASGSAHNANIRFMWNQETNKISRAYISGSSNISDRFLVLEGDAKMYDKDGNALSISGLNANEINLVDDQNFVYEQTIQVNTSARAKLTAKYNNIVQYFRGSEGAFADGTTVELLGGSASGKHKMRIVYDFKTNRLVTAYLPSGTIDESMAINADLMLVREHQEDGEQITFSGSGALSDVHTVYGVMRFNRWTLNNKEKTGGHSPVGDPKSVYERSLYWISFPFDVNLSDVFGFGTYGVDWIIEYYDGAERATNGYWKDSPGFWKMVMPAQRASYLLEAGKGYVLAIDIDRMKDNNTDFWTNNIEQVELFFPSATNTVGAIEATNVTTSVEAHACTIDRTGNNGNDINKNRTKADSHWNMIGVPSYANYGTTIKDGEKGSTITWRNDPTVAALPYLYEWNMVDDSYTVQSGTTYPFKAMHSYMVQYYGNLYWSLASATPSSIVARRTYDEAPQNAEFRLELQQNEKMVDQTFVKLSNDEQVSADFVFDEDLCKEYNGSKANIYTFIENYIPAAGNTLPMNEQTTIVPVGVKITATGDYTFAIPDGTSGIGVTLIDTENNIRTSLSALSYTVNLTAGTHDGRFLLEIAPIQQTPTDIDLINGENGENGVRKMLIDQQMYIIRDGKIYDARGARVQ